MKAVSGIGVEIASIFVICSANDVIEIAMNFIALAVVADFDDIVFKSLQNENFALLLDPEFTSSALKIQHTTSKRCGVDDLSESKDDKGQQRKLRINLN